MRRTGRMPRLGPRLGFALVPLAIGVLAAAVVALVGANGVFHVDVPLSTVLVLAGAVLTIVLGIVLIVPPLRRARARTAVTMAREEGAASERDAHRRFLARLDHELKNPVTAIRSALAAGDDLPVENVRIAAAQAARLSSLASELRALSELETREIERGAVDLTALVGEEVEAVGDELRARGEEREIVTVFPTAPWPLSPVAGDADLLAVVVRNLVLNAVKYSDPGARIEVRGVEEGESVLLDVADTGWGIRAEDQPFVWDELWRAPDARTVEGSGLGLSLVRTVVQRHGGTVALRSQPGSGTDVQLRLPRFNAAGGGAVGLPATTPPRHSRHGNGAGAGV